MAAAKYTFTYFNFRWIAEPIRYLLRYAGQDFEDVRLDWDAWEKTSLEERLGKFKYGKLPYLVERDENGQVVVELSQSFTITRYLGVKFGLVAATTEEQAKCEEYADCVKDILKEVEVLFEAEAERKPGLRATLLDKTFPRYLSVIEKELGEKRKTTTGFVPLVGDSLTWTDVLVAHYTELFAHYMKANAGNDENSERAQKLLDNYPEIRAHQNGVLSLEQIKRWIEQRPVTEY